jgi:glycosyltransferase involved in cell wall biosynthesis
VSRKLIIDGQIFQTPAWHRGMGKYSLELVKVLSQLEGTASWSSIDILLSEHLKSEKSMLSELRSRAPNANIIMLDLSPNDFRNKKVAAHNQKTVDRYLGTLSQPLIEVDYLILAIMQREIFPAFPSIDSVNKLILFYDLIPLMLHNSYLKSSVAKAEYLPKIAELLKADRYFTISKTVANDLTLYLGIDKSRITNIDGGPINHSSEMKPIKIPEPFILMPTGNDPRKNNRRAILGFNEFNKLQSGKYTLVITSFFSDREKKELSELTDNIHFTGNISGQELSYLYEQSSAVLFPSEHEGLGLPILEAVEKNKPVACSNISVFREMSATAFCYFEPKSIIGIEAALKVATSSPNTNQKVYKEIIAKYTWENTAQRFAETVFELTKKTKSASRSKPSIAVFGPDPVSSESCGKFMQECHGELSRLFNADYYLSNDENKDEDRINYLHYITKVRGMSRRFSFERNNYSVIIYHLFNSAECAGALLAALAVPGIVILHDTRLEKVWHALKAENLISQQRYDLEVKIDDTYAVPGISMLGSLLKNQKSIIVFSEYQKKLLMQLTGLINSGLKIHLANLPVGNLVYPQAIPEKTIDVGKVHENMLTGGVRQADIKTDLQYDEALSKMKIVIFDEDSSKYKVVSAMRFGSIPCISKDGWHADFSSSITIKYKSATEINDLTQELLLDESKRKVLRENVVQYAQNSSMKQFIQQLQEIAEDR